MMYGFLFFFVFANSAFGLNSPYVEPTYGGPIPSGPSTNEQIFVDTGLEEDVITLTVYSTHDSFTTLTNGFFNTVPVTITEFSKATITLPTREIVRTPVDDIVKVSTLQVTRTATETVTDVYSLHKCSTEVSTEFITVTHLDQRILQTTLTRATVTTITFRPTIVQTVISTEREVATETETVTRTIWVDAATTATKFYYN